MKNFLLAYIFAPVISLSIFCDLQADGIKGESVQASAYRAGFAVKCSNQQSGRAIAIGRSGFYPVTGVGEAITNGQVKHQSRMFVFSQGYLYLFYDQPSFFNYSSDFIIIPSIA